MQPAEWEAYTLHLQRVPVEDIAEKTRLSRPRIAAAVDLGRLHAQAVLQTPAIPAAPQPARVRLATRRQLPGATIPPSRTLAEAPDLEPTRARPSAIATTTSPTAAAAAPASAAAPEPDLHRLAHSPEVRAWAAADGWLVPAEGLRLPGGIVHAYLRAHGGTQ